MAGMNAGVALTHTFPTSAFDQPSRWQLHSGVMLTGWIRGDDGVGWESREPCLQRECFLEADNRIGKKTPCIAESCWIRQPPRADRDHSLGNFLRVDGLFR